MNIFAKPQAYKTYMADKDEARKAAVGIAKNCNNAELAAKVDELQTKADARLSEETSKVDAEIAGQLQAYVAEINRRQSVVIDTEKLQR